MSWRALLKMFGLGRKEKEEKKTAAAPPRQHPYDEVSDEQLAENRRSPRVHPYDEVSDAVLEENRNSRPVRRHNYDEVDLDRTMSKVGRGKSGTTNGACATEPELNYVEVDIKPSTTGSQAAVRTREEPTIYSEMQPRAM